jgi:hypothetical protein
MAAGFEFGAAIKAARVLPDFSDSPGNGGSPARTLRHWQDHACQGQSLLLTYIYQS